MSPHKFECSRIDKLNDPRRLDLLDLEAICRRFGLHGGETLVEVGAGTGFFSEALLDMLPGALCLALDVNPEMISWMENNRRTFEDGRLFPRLMKESEIPLDEGSGDFLFMIALHHELDEPDALLKECRRVLKPGRKIMIADWKKEAGGFGPPVKIRVEPATAVSQLESAGFKGVAVFDCSGAFFCVEGSA